MMPDIPNPDRLAAACTDLLTTAAGCLTDAPSRQVVSPGEPAHVCPMLAVWPITATIFRTPIASGTSAAKQEVRPREVALGLLYLRTVCTKLKESAGEVNTDGLAVATNGWRLFAGIENAMKAGTLFTTVQPPMLYTSGNVRLASIVEREGELAGWRYEVVVSL